ncbi:MAG: hypothetical protein QOD07_2280 [Frankiaceae bacterium]|nr:hypothetical protein [Frankiaceae bacterium]
MAREAHGGGLFGPDSVTWRVNREAVLLAGGARALILQVSHPSVAAGVAQHSDYDTDPWGRLYRTLDLTTKITFGDAETSDRAARILRGAHHRVNGERSDGASYDARDPDLLLWVWATLVESSLLMYTRYVQPLGPADVERYYAEQQRFAVACSVPEGHWPSGHAAFMDYFDTTVRDALHPTDDSRAIVDSVMHPSLPLPVRPVFDLVNLATVGLLPPVLRERLGLSWGPNRERLLAASTAATRRALPLLPGLLREFPVARRASRRARQLAA